MVVLLVLLSSCKVVTRLPIARADLLLFPEGVRDKTLQLLVSHQEEHMKAAE